MLDVYNILKLIKSSEVNLVIIGTEPYSNSIVENNKLIYYNDGLIFSCSKTLKEHSQLLVLKNLFRKLSTCNWYPNDLSYLINQGVFIMPVYWEVEEHKPKSRQTIEQFKFSIKVLNKIIAGSGQVPVITLGRDAAKLVTNTKAKLIFNETHPSEVRFNKNDNWGLSTFTEACKYTKNKILWGKN